LELEVLLDQLLRQQLVAQVVVLCLELFLLLEAVEEETILEEPTVVLVVDRP
jgi:diacylglycerol kinase